MEKLKIVVIGGVACGPKTAARIKRLKPDADVTVIEKKELLSYSGCGLPYYLSGEIKDHKELMATPVGIVRDTHFFKVVKDIRVLNQTFAKSVARAAKKVTTVNTMTGEIIEIPYDRLVLAVGSTPFLPEIKGVDLKDVYTLSTVEDAREIRDRRESLKGKKAVIIGGGLIGLEVTEAFRIQGMDVTIVEREDTVLPSHSDPEMAFHVHNELRARGVKLALSSAVSEIKGDDQGKVVSVVTSKGEIQADIVLVSVGVRPNSSLAKQMGLEIGTTGAIKTDEYLRTSDPDIYAGGDCSEVWSRQTGKPIYAPMGSTANKQGRIIADNICGIPTKFRGVLGTVIIKIFGLTFACTGMTERQAKNEGLDYLTVLNPSPDRPHFMESAKLLIIKLIVDKKTGKIIGSQMTGPGEAAKRMDVTVSAMSQNANVYDLGQYDLAYAPPYSPAMDNIITAANIAENKISGIAKGYSPAEVMEKIRKDDDFIFLDVRTPDEFAQVRIPDKRVKHIPLGKLRQAVGDLPKNKEIITFCKISLRGYEAQRILEGEGFGNVSFLDGGVVCWPYEKEGV
ncbi:FAD-dependent oxidoreductase [Desulforegula conservatrix]|uniref:FAD-dependent oxidoreductase n=1 Tax=Desulforegula conservatrix TaxID=153026 RepID=UPI00040FB731|nr:FAD-dependent oxidoreductase [Desulforegula conservatrix]